MLIQRLRIGSKRHGLHALDEMLRTPSGSVFNAPDNNQLLGFAAVHGALEFLTRQNVVLVEVGTFEMAGNIFECSCLFTAYHAVVVLVQVIKNPLNVLRRIFWRDWPRSARHSALRRGRS